MKLKRSKIWYCVVRTLTDRYISSMHEILVKGHENIPKEGAALIVSKHQLKRDIPLQGWVLNNFVGRPANWLMKSSMSSCYDYTGAVRIHQKKEIIGKLKASGRVKKLYWDIIDSLDNPSMCDFFERALMNENIKEADFLDFNKKAIDYANWLYAQGEIIVFQSEGTRELGKMGKINSEFIEHTYKIKELYGEHISLILMGIKYEDPETKGSRVLVNIEEMNWREGNRVDLRERVYSGLERLSGLD